MRTFWRSYRKERPRTRSRRTARWQSTHGISVNHLAQELAELITAGKMNWKKFGGVHPNQYGNTMCATMIANALLPEWQKPLAVDAVAKDHPAVPLLDPKSYSRGRSAAFL